MIKIICENDVINEKTKKGSCDLELVLKGDPRVLSSQLANALKEIYDANPEILSNTFRILDHLIEGDDDE